MHKMNYYKVAVKLLFLMIVFNTDAFANVDANPFHVKVWGKYISSADLEGQNGSLVVGKVNIRIIGNFKVGEDIPLDVSVGGDHYLVVKKDTLNIPYSMKSRGLHVDTMFPFHDSGDTRYYVGVLVNPSFQSANTVIFDVENFRMRGGGYLALKQTENLLLKLGAVYRSRYNIEVFPYVGLNYKIGENIGVDVSSNESALTANFDYFLNEANTVFFTYEYNQDEFEVNGGDHDGKGLTFSDQSFGIGLKHRFNKHLTATVEGGEVIKRKIAYLDDTGKAIPKAAPYVGCSVKVNF